MRVSVRRRRAPRGREEVRGEGDVEACDAEERPEQRERQWMMFLKRTMPAEPSVNAASLKCDVCGA
jgi:hypothetical protein